MLRKPQSGPDLLLLLSPLMQAEVFCSVGGQFYSSHTLDGMKWAGLTVFFGPTVPGLFSYLKNAHSVTNAHLYSDCE